MSSNSTPASSSETLTAAASLLQVNASPAKEPTDIQEEVLDATPTPEVPLSKQDRIFALIDGARDVATYGLMGGLLGGIRGAAAGASAGALVGYTHMRQSITGKKTAVKSETRKTPKR